MSTLWKRGGVDTVFTSTTVAQVQVVLVGEQVLRFNNEAGGDKVLPVCSSYLSAIRKFITNSGSSPMDKSKLGAYTDAFKAAFNFFHPDNDTGTCCDLMESPQQ